MWQGEADDLMLLHQPLALPLCALVPSAFLWAVGVSKVQHVCMYMKFLTKEMRVFIS